MIYSTRIGYWLPLLLWSKFTLAGPLVENACGDNERWNFGASKISKEVQDDFKKSLRGEIDPVASAAQGYALKNSAESLESTFLSHYWIAHTLNDLHLPHSAMNGLSYIASRPLSSETEGIQFAALECLLKLHETHPAISLSGELASRLPEYADHAHVPRRLEIFRQAIDTLLVQKIGDPDSTKKELLGLLDLLKDSGPHESFAIILISSVQKQFDIVIEEGSLFLRLSELPENLKRYSNMVRLLLGRAYYASGQFELASSNFSQINQKGINAPTELAWSYLLEQRYGEAIGTAINLQSGSLRQRFAPEAPMIISMALHELCQYADAVRAIQYFKDTYEKPYLWLKTWKEKFDRQKDYNTYALATDTSSSKDHPPEKIVSEWSHTPAFVSYQTELQGLSEEFKTSLKLEQKAQTYDEALVDSVHTLVKGLGTSSHSLSSKSSARKLGALQRKLTLEDQVRKSGPLWQGLAAQARTNFAELKTQLTTEVNSYLNALNQQMWLTLQDVNQNTRTIDDEMVAGAHLKRSDRKIQASSDWNWPIRSTPMRPKREIWKQELGSFRGNFNDNCSNPEKYFVLRR